jgi:hypothetical protein
MSTPAHLEQASDEATKALDLRALASVKTAFKFTGGIGSFSAVVLGALALAKAVTTGVFIGLGAITIVSWPVAFVVLEFERLSYHTKALRSLVATHKNYDLLLSQARRERDDAKADGDALRAERALFVASSQLVQQLALNPKKDG